MGERDNMGTTRKPEVNDVPTQSNLSSMSVPLQRTKYARTPIAQSTEDFVANLERILIAHFLACAEKTSATVCVRATTVTYG